MRKLQTPPPVGIFLVVASLFLPLVSADQNQTQTYTLNVGLALLGAFGADTWAEGLATVIYNNGLIGGKSILDQLKVTLMLPWTGAGFKIGARMLAHSLLIGAKHLNYGDKGAGVSSGILSSYENALYDGRPSVIDEAALTYARNIPPEYPKEFPRGIHRHLRLKILPQKNKSGLWLLIGAIPWLVLGCFCANYGNPLIATAWLLQSFGVIALLFSGRKWVPFNHKCDNCEIEQVNVLRDQTRSKSIIEIYACKELYNDSRDHACKPHVWKGRWMYDSIAALFITLSFPIGLIASTLSNDWWTISWAIVQLVSCIAGFMGWLFVRKRIIPIEPSSVKAFPWDDNINGIVQSGRWGEVMKSYAGPEYKENKLLN